MKCPNCNSLLQFGAGLSEGNVECSECDFWAKLEDFMDQRQDQYHYHRLY